MQLPNLEHIRRMDQRLYETLITLKEAFDSLAIKAGIVALGQIATPTIQSLTVSAANGIFVASITDNSTNHPGINYFIEYADNPNFNNAKTIALGPSRDMEGLALGNVTRYFRAFSQYQSSAPSPRVNFGGLTPTAVVGGGSAP